ncbi:MAG: filamentous hemagglutinin N-terminal domain-containing protein [Candidatus Parabeggiatoa sp.]|nr:filamentous hemagglutinin N-terminal domain-containing protein [Candidatus Parabeggiatoa sp.]
MSIPFLLIVFIGLFSIPKFGGAEIILDGSLGHSGPLPGPDFKIGAELGQQYGGNLFHSFRQFDIAVGERATFSGPDTVNNVISRVTGGEVSNINGLLRSTLPHADLYLINPAGVMFGEQAQLDVLGSFYVSTADYLRFSDGAQFHASLPENSLLTVAPPTAFGFLNSNQAPISVQGSALSVPDTETLSIMAGDITLTEGGLHAPMGTVHLSSVASAGELSVNPEMSSLDNFALLGHITLSEFTLGNAVYGFDGAHRIYIRGGQFWMADSVINAKVKKRRGAASQIVMSSREAVVLEQDAVMATDSFSITDAGEMRIETQNLMMRGNAMMSSDTQRGGAAGVITIQAHQVTITDEAKISSSTSHEGGSSGRIHITADALDMRGETQIKATSRGTDQAAGQIIIIADQVQMADDATLDTIAFADANGDGGAVSIEAKTLKMTDRAWIISSAFNRGQSGPINIEVDHLFLSGESAIASTTFSQGKGGNIRLRVHDSLSISDAAVVTSGTEGEGQGGTVMLVLPADKITIADIAQIDSASGVKNVVTDEIARMLELAKQLGGEVDGSVFTGGGRPGKVFIQADNLSLESRGIKSLLEPLQLEYCENPSAEKGSFISDRREGLYEAFSDL